MFTRELVSSLRHAAATAPGFPHVTFVFQGTAEQGRETLAPLWPDLRAVAVEDLALYRAFGLARGGLKEVFGPRVWLAGLRALSRGHFVGRPVGDPWAMPGAFLLRAGAVLWSDRFEHAGRHPDFEHAVRSVREDDA